MLSGSAPGTNSPPTDARTGAGEPELPVNTRDTFPLGFLTLPSVEECVRQTPALGDQPDVVLALLVGEVLRRRAAGEVPDLEEYRGRFPAHADALQRALFSDAPAGRTEPEPT